MMRRQPRTSKILGVVLIGMICMGSMLFSQRATAFFQEFDQFGEPGFLVLSRDSRTAQYGTVNATDSMHWIIRAELFDAESGELRMSFDGAGKLIALLGIEVEVSACEVFIELVGNHPECVTGYQTELARTPLSTLINEGRMIPLSEINEHEPRHFLVTFQNFRLEEGIETRGMKSEFGVGFHANGENDQEMPVNEVPGSTNGQLGDRLANSGSDFLPILLISIGLVGISVIILRGRRDAPAVIPVRRRSRGDDG